jgi:hypothetical protein
MNLSNKAWKGAFSRKLATWWRLCGDVDICPKIGKIYWKQGGIIPKAF